MKSDTTEETALELQKRTFPQLFASKIAGVQPIAAPSGVAFAMRQVYGEISKKEQQEIFDKELSGKLDDLGFGDEITDEILNSEPQEPDYDKMWTVIDEE